jgi:hypothetical protein
MKKEYAAPKIITLPSRDVVAALGYASASVYREPLGDVGD